MGLRMSIIEQRDFFGHYIILLNKECLGERLSSILSSRNTIIEEYSDIVIVKSKSRSIVDKIVKQMSKYIES